jgi:N-ethylmaleimide reductase
MKPRFSFRGIGASPVGQGQGARSTTADRVDLQLNCEAPGAPSAIAAEGYAYTRRGEAPFSMRRALDLHEILGSIAEFRSGAERALRAGFGGVEIHGANGYLPEQFLQGGTNKRTDEYSGPIETAPASCWR